MGVGSINLQQFKDLLGRVSNVLKSPDIGTREHAIIDLTEASEITEFEDLFRWDSEQQKHLFKIMLDLFFTGDLYLSVGFQAQRAMICSFLVFLDRDNYNLLLHRGLTALFLECAISDKEKHLTIGDILQKCHLLEQVYPVDPSSNPDDGCFFTEDNLLENGINNIFFSFRYRKPKYLLQLMKVFLVYLDLKAFLPADSSAIAIFNNYAYLDSLDAKIRQKLIQYFLEQIPSLITSYKPFEEISPYLLFITLSEEFIDSLNQEVLASIFKVVFLYILPLDRDARARHEFLDYSQEHLKPITLKLFCKGLSQQNPHFLNFSYAEYSLILALNPFELDYPEAVFDDIGFTVPKCLQGLYSTYTLKLLTIFGGPKFRGYFPYHLVRLLLQRKEYYTKNWSFLRNLAAQVKKNEGKKYYEALKREFSILAELTNEIEIETRK